MSTNEECNSGKMKMLLRWEEAQKQPWGEENRRA
jgi:hypothetical protein